jgi:hypothetical protein
MPDSLDDDDSLGEPMVYGYGNNHVHSFSGGHTKTSSLRASKKQVQDYLLSPVGQELVRRVLAMPIGKRNAVSTGDDDDPYLHPMLVHGYLCSPNAPECHHFWMLIIWVTRICTMLNGRVDDSEDHNRNQPQRRTPELQLEAECLHAVGLPNVAAHMQDAVALGNLELYGERESGFRDHLLHTEPMAQALRVILCDQQAPVNPYWRVYVLHSCIELVTAWQRGAFDDVDYMREEAYIEGMLNTIFGRGAMPDY